MFLLLICYIAMVIQGFNVTEERDFDKKSPNFVAPFYDEVQLPQG